MEFFKVPEALQWEHDLIREQLARAVHESGSTGKAAEAVVEALRPHIVKEEDFALPALGLLQHLVAGRVSPVMRGVIEMTDRLKAQYEQMRADHEVIVATVYRLAEAAVLDRKLEYVGLSKRLLLHMKTEEQVLYPAAILIGEYLKLTLDGLPPEIRSPDHEKVTG
jgi:iron-sulfur cluster repair protein YtfE (RIC family)